MIKRSKRTNLLAMYCKKRCNMQYYGTFDAANKNVQVYWKAEDGTYRRLNTNTERLTLQQQANRFRNLYSGAAGGGKSLQFEALMKANGGFKITRQIKLDSPSTDDYYAHYDWFKEAWLKVSEDVTELLRKLRENDLSFQITNNLYKRGTPLSSLPRDQY